MMNIVAVVVTYNRKDLLVECLEAILRQTYKVNKIVIIDNNSTDGTYEKLQETKILDNKEIIVYKKLEKNIGGAGGFYEGMKLSKQYNPDFVWIMDDDTIPNKNCLEKLIDANSFLNENKEKVSFLASTIYGEKGEFMNVPVVDDRPSDNGYPDWYKYLNKGIVEIKIATFVSLLINIEAINSCGLPCKDFFIWGDDQEYTERISRLFPCFYIAQSVVVHHTAQNTGSDIVYDTLDRIGRYYYKYRNEWYISRRNGMLSRLYYLFRLLKDTFHIVLISREKKRRLQVMYQGFWKGLVFRPAIHYLSEKETESYVEQIKRNL